MKPEPEPPASARQMRRPDPGRLCLLTELRDERIRRLVLARERGLVRVDVLLHERAHLGAARGHVRLEREVGHERESARVGERKPGPERDLPRRRRRVAGLGRRLGGGGARAARAGPVRLRRRRRRVGGDDSGEPGGVRAAPAAAPDAHRQLGARPLGRGARAALDGAVPARTGRSALDRPSRRRARGRARLEGDRRADDPLERGLDAARGRRRGARRCPTVVPALLVGRPRAGRQPRRPGRGGRLRCDRRHARHADARLALPRPAQRLPALPRRRGAGPVLQRPALPASDWTRRRRRTCSRPR